jgi:hypothetical protein
MSSLAPEGLKPIFAGIPCEATEWPMPPIGKNGGKFRRCLAHAVSGHPDVGAKCSALPEDAEMIVLDCSYRFLAPGTASPYSNLPLKKFSCCSKNGITLHPVVLDRLAFIQGGC